MGLFSRFRKKETIKTEELKPDTRSIKVTDFTSGESVTTETNTSGKTGVITTTRKVSSAGGGSVTPQRQEQLISATESLEDSGNSIYSPPENTPVNRGNTLTPAQSTISANQYTGQPPERYNRGLGSAIGETFSNLGNVGIIGQYGFSSYLNQAFIDPYEYVGKPKAYSNMPNYNLANWGGTDFGYGLPEDKKNMYRPEQYQTITYFEQGERNKKKLFNEYGLTYSGEPVSLIPQRTYEKVANDLRPEYQKQADAGVDINIVNEQFNTAIETEYSRRIGDTTNFNKKIYESQKYTEEIFTPPAYPIIKTTGKVIETGALIGASVWGGSTATLLASQYLTFQTAKGAVNYAGDFKQMSTGQKIVGGAGLGLSAYASVYTLNLGVNKFYSEYRNIIYTDLANSPARVSGREVYKTSEFTRYNIASTRKIGGGAESLTLQTTDVYNTGANRVGFYTKGVTTTKIFDPQTEKFLVNVDSFRSSGYVPNINEGLALSARNTKVGLEGYYSGAGSGVYQDYKIIKGYGFTASSKDVGEAYNVVGGKDPYKAFVSYKGGAKTYTYRSTFDSSGQIFKMTEGDTSNLIIGSGKKSSQQFYNQLYGGAIASQTAKQSQTIGINSLKQNVKGSSAQILGGKTTQSVATTQRGSVITAFSLPNVNELYPSQVEDTKVINVNTNINSLTSRSKGRGAFSSLVNAGNREDFIQGSVVTPINAQAQINKIGLRNAGVLISPMAFNFGGGSYNVDIPNKPFIFIPDLSSSIEGLPSNQIVGGERKTGYTPSFSALVFNLRGSYSKGKLGESGLDYRPITKGFRFKSGLGGIKLKLK